MAEPKISPEKITKPIQILAVWFVGLIALVGALLTGASQIDQPPWICPLLVISAIALIPLFIILIFVLQTKFRTQFLDDEYYAEWLKRQEDIIDQMESRIAASTDALVSSSASMKDMTEFGINRVYSNQDQALSAILKDIEKETSELCFVGLSLSGILVREGEYNLRQIIEQKSKIPGLRIRFLLTHPSMASFREQQEGRAKGDIEREILDSISILKEIGIEASSIKFYVAPPSASAIFTSRKMLFVPYSYSASPYESISFIIDNSNESPFYEKMRASHFEKPWNSSMAVQLDKERQKNLSEQAETLISQFINP